MQIYTKYIHPCITYEKSSVSFGRDSSRPYSKIVNRVPTIKFIRLCIIQEICVTLQIVIYNRKALPTALKDFVLLWGAKRY